MHSQRFVRLSVRYVVISRGALKVPRLIRSIRGIFRAPIRASDR